jgi:hypothetical protein
MSLQIASALANLFRDANPAVQITLIVCMTAISIFAMVLGNFEIAFIAIIAFSPTPILALIASGAGMRDLINKFDLMAVASSAHESKMSKSKKKFDIEEDE